MTSARTTSGSVPVTRDLRGVPSDVARLGEPEMKAFARRAREAAESLEAALQSLGGVATRGSR